MWPVDALIDIAQKVIMLGLCVGGWCWLQKRSPRALFASLLSTSGPARGWRWPSQAGLLAVTVALSGLGWVGLSASYGPAQTLAMALGGPTVQETKLCRDNTYERIRFGLVPPCPFDGKITTQPDGAEICDKHGEIVNPWKVPR